MTPAEIIGPVQGTGADLVPSPSLSIRRASSSAHRKAENTLRGYQSDWREFCAWCEGHGVCPLPAAPKPSRPTSPNVPGTAEGRAASSGD